MNKLLKAIVLGGIGAAAALQAVPTDAAEIYSENAYYEEGDLDGNHAVNLQDVQLALKITLKIETPNETQEWLMDMNHNNKADLKDVQQILKRVLKMTEQSSGQKKNVVIQGKKYQGCFEGVEKIYDCDTDYYWDKENALLTYYDHETGQFIGIGSLLTDTVSEGNKISTNEAVGVAEEFLESVCDFSDYTLQSIYHDEYSGYSISYTKEPDEASSAGSMILDMYDDGKIHSFVYVPYVYDDESGIMVDAANLEDIKNQLTSVYGDRLLRYGVKERAIGIHDGKATIRAYLVEYRYKVGDNGLSFAAAYVFRYDTE